MKMKRNLVLTVMLLAVIAGFVAFAIRGMRSRNPIAAPAVTLNATNAPGNTPPPHEALQGAHYTPTKQLPAGWENFMSISEAQRLNRVTAVMNNRTLPADLLALFEGEIFNRKHMAVTRNNMANALVWQETPNPQLHKLFVKMLEDETESPVWRDYCLQFLSECLKSSSDPEVIKAVLSRYAKGTNSLAGTAIVHIGYQEGEGRLHVDEAFSKQLESQLADPQVVLETKLSILGVIGQRHDTRLLPLVRTYAKDSNDGLRRCAMATLGLIGTAEDLPLIQPGLTDPNRAVQLAAKAAEERIRSRFPPPQE